MGKEMTSIAIIGGVGSTRETLKELHRAGFDNIDVYGYEPSPGRIVSGFVDLAPVAEMLGCRYAGFQRINDHVELFRSKRYDILFVVGLSQLVADAIITSARIGCVGFHPTRLPRGRGRAPIAWLVMHETEGAATFFQIGPGMAADAGPIFCQSVFTIDPAVDDAGTVQAKVHEHIPKALRQWLPRLRAGEWNPVPQDERMATEYGVRRAEDGFVDWSQEALSVSAHIRAAMPPHPGAMAFMNGQTFEIRVGRDELVREIKGVIGRVLKKNGNRYLVQARDGALWIETDFVLRVGDQLGVSSPYRLCQLERRLDELETRMIALEGRHNER